MEDKETTELDWYQIAYALQPKRLLGIDQPLVWKDFHCASKDNNENYYEYTPDQLCKRFLDQVLVRIYDYELNEEELHLMKLMELHPNFRRTENGFSIVDTDERIDLRRDSLHIMESPMIENTVEDLNCQIVLGPSSNVGPPGKPLSMEISAIFSILLSIDSDLTRCERLTNLEIRKRMREAKRLYSDKGELLPNLSITVEDLIEKLKSLCDIKRATADIVEKVVYQ
ncbi:uncharacterized protein LOC142232797 [Haematobia irritans]|uniref:uncharacterized protein LOC142232797 n=1 Tax=Haematobia irritans TaxID=7368 RepID=UPI003F4FFFBF